MGNDTPLEPSEGGDRLDGAHVAGPSLSLATLADLHAGVFDSTASAPLWQRAEDEPAARQALSALDRVRADLAHWLDGPAPEVPGPVVERIAAALHAESTRSTPQPLAAADGQPSNPSGNLVTGPVSLEHRRRPAAKHRWIAYSAAGLTAAACAAIAIALVAKTDRTPPETTSAQPGLSQMTSLPPTNAPAAPVLPAPENISGGLPLSTREITALVGRAPVYGALEDPARRASCLAGLGFAASTPVLGAQTIDANGPAILLVLPTERPGELLAVAVRSGCDSSDPQRVAQTRIGAAAGR